MSVFDREKHLEFSLLRKKLNEFPPNEVFTTIITFEEQMRGWLAYLAGCKNIEQQTFAYERLNKFLNNFREIAVLEFDEKAAKVFQKLKSNKIRIGTMDLKIASIAMANEAILVSRNIKDFEQVPDLTVQDWTR